LYESHLLYIHHSNILCAIRLDGICSSEEDLRTSDAIRKVKEFKVENLEFSSVTAKENEVRVEGYAIGNQPIANFRNMISQRIGYSQVLEIMPMVRNGQHVSHFVIELEPYFRAVPQLVDATSFVKVYAADGGAWFNNLEFSPFGQSIRGIPIKEIDPNWCNANVFKKELFPHEVYKGSGGLDEILKGDFGFSATSKFDGVNQMTALVGVYETCDKQHSGNFLLVLDDNKNHQNKIIFLVQFGGDEFAFLENSHRNGFSLWTCWGCDNSRNYQWNKSTKEFVEVFSESQ
jgi:hypothetical protein